MMPKGHFRMFIVCTGLCEKTVGNKLDFLQFLSFNFDTRKYPMEYSILDKCGGTCLYYQHSVVSGAGGLPSRPALDCLLRSRVA